jgi:hypothetical protein
MHTWASIIANRWKTAGNTGTRARSSEHLAR